MSCFWKHTWSKWETVSDGIITLWDDGRKLRKGTFEEQRRTCEVCGMVQRRTEENYI